MEEGRMNWRKEGNDGEDKKEKEMKERKNIREERRRVNQDM